MREQRGNDGPDRWGQPKLRAAQATLVGAPLLAPGLAGLQRWMRWRAAHQLVPSMEAAPRAAEIIILGARLDPWGAPLASLADRLEVGFRLWAAGKAPRVVVSGDAHSPHGDEIAAMTRWMRWRGLPDAALVVDAGAQRTLGSVAHAHDRLGGARALLVSQRDHLARALFLARALGVDLVGVPADRRRYRRGRDAALYEWAACGRAFVDVAMHAWSGGGAGEVPASRSSLAER